MAEMQYHPASTLMKVWVTLLRYVHNRYDRIYPKRHIGCAVFVAGALLSVRRCTNRRRDIVDFEFKGRNCSCEVIGMDLSRALKDSVESLSFDFHKELRMQENMCQRSTELEEQSQLPDINFGKVFCRYIESWSDKFKDNETTRRCIADLENALTEFRKNLLTPTIWDVMLFNDTWSTQKNLEAAIYVIHLRACLD